MTADFEDQIYDQQEKMIHEAYGPRRAAEANYGQGIDEGDDYIQIETKVYGVGRLISTGWYKDGTIEHRWELLPR
jgi:hypothetical protein